MFLRINDSSSESVSCSENGAGVWFSQKPIFSFFFQVIKYGVISTDTLIDDLLHWKTLYVAGRLQKPVNIRLFSYLP